MNAAGDPHAPSSAGAPRKEFLRPQVISNPCAGWFPLPATLTIRHTEAIFSKNSRWCFVMGNKVAAAASVSRKEAMRNRVCDRCSNGSAGKFRPASWMEAPHGKGGSAGISCPGSPSATPCLHPGQADGKSHATKSLPKSRVINYMERLPTAQLLCFHSISTDAACRRLDQAATFGVGLK